MTEITFGKVPHPPFADRPITKAGGAGQDNLGKRSVKGVVWHRMIGTLWGTDGYFRNDGVNSLTDYGVGVTATDGADNDGAIIRWNDPLGWQSGWASGPVSSPYGDGLAFLDDNGWDLNVVNRDEASIEISGNYDTPLSDGARQAIAALTAYWADQAHIPWDVFPIIPGKGYSFVRWHQEFTIGSGKVCPGPVVMQETSALIERTRQILKAAQTAAKPAKPPVYVESVLPEWWDDTLTQIHPTDQHVDGLRYWAIRRNVAALANTRRLSAPDLKAKASGPNVQTREKVFTERQVTANGRTFWLTVDGHYVLASKFSPDVRIKSR